MVTAATARGITIGMTREKCVVKSRSKTMVSGSKRGKLFSLKDIEEECNTAFGEPGVCVAQTIGSRLVPKSK